MAVIAVTSEANPNPKPPRPSTFQLKDSPIENFRPLRVIVIGAGYSGIYCGIRIPERLRNVELVIYEKNEGVGGTWWENRYLGCACDIPSHSYQYSFEPNPNWSSLYAPAAEIRDYLERVSKKYSVDRFTKLSHEVTQCRWNGDSSAKWSVTVKNLVTGETINDECDILISARGNLNNPSWPQIPGLETFKGELMHSAKWNESYDWTDKRIGVIGSGSSSIQIVPSLQRIPGTHVTNFARSKTWITPPFSAGLWEKYGFKDSFSIPQTLRDKFASDPEHYERFRLAVEEDGATVHALTIKGTDMQINAVEEFRQIMKSRLASAPEIYQALLPSFAPGCRRLTPGPGYLEALTQPNVSFVTSAITRISETAVHTSDGVTHELDALICATGFKTSAPPPFAVLGANGLPLTKKWEKRATTYLSHSISGFPNMFSMLGPNAAISTGSLTNMIESVGDYVVKCIRKVQKENIATMHVKQEREDDFTEFVDRYFEGTVNSDDCSSWYKDAKSGAVVGLWPGSTLHCIECMRSPRWEDFDYTYLDEYVDAPVGAGGLVARNRANRLAWLGNGWSVNQLEKKHMAWYLYPEHMDKPTAPKPEDTERYNIRAFSY